TSNSEPDAVSSDQVAPTVGRQYPGQREPRTNIVPSKQRRSHNNRPGFFHHTEIDGDARKLRIGVPEVGRLFCDALQAVPQIGQEASDQALDEPNAPEENAAVPKVGCMM